MKKQTLLLYILSPFLLTACESGSELSGPSILGSSGAPVLLEEFSDPQCPACGIVSPIVEEMVRRNPELVRLEYYHFPLSYHEYAFIGAEASECAGEQGKFFEYLGTLFKNQSSLNEDYLYKVADSLELERESFDACLEEHRYKGKVLAHMAEGRRRKIPGTPTLYVNGQMVKWSDAETFEAYLKSLAHQ